MATGRHQIIVQDPPIAQFLFSDVRLAWLWLVLRVWLGWQWFDAGWHKVTSADWMTTGGALQKFWERATGVPEQGRPVVAYDWYRGFLQMLLEGGH
ncbi:MAG: DoxX family protein, partial [Chloroflexota bacterium]